MPPLALPLKNEEEEIEQQRSIQGEARKETRSYSLHLALLVLFDLPSGVENGGGAGAGAAC